MRDFVKGEARQSGAQPVAVIGAVRTFSLPVETQNSNCSFACGRRTRTRRSGSQLALAGPSEASWNAASTKPSGTGRACQ